jgi:hypothetical protein
VLTGDWAAFEREVALGLELERDHPDAVADDDVRREATAFRYAHGLISAADFRRWLEARELTVGDLSGVLHRRLLRETGVRAEGPSASDEEVIGVLPPEAFCDGVLARLAGEAIDRLVAGHLVPGAPAMDDGRIERAVALVPQIRALLTAGLPANELRKRLARLIALDDALERLRGEVATPEAIAARMRQHALEWTQLVGEELRFTREGAAREARLQITDDGDTAQVVAQRAQVSALDRRLLVGEAPAAVGVSLAAAALGEVVGPWEEDGQWHVMKVRAKVPPSADDRSLSERASDELLRERIARHAAGRTTRHAPL